MLAVLHKFYKQCYPNGLGNLGSLDSSIESGLTIINISASSALQKLQITIEILARIDG